MFLAGISVADSQQIAEHFHFDAGKLPVRYLGLPLVTKRITRADYTPLLEQIKKRIGSWTARYLSFAGRFNLISSILWSVCNFWLAAFRLPRECIREIDKLCSAFLWSGSELSSKKAKISWAKVCTPKAEGGLGLRSLKEANDVCCLKLIWRIISHGNSLWVKWIDMYLLKKDTIWTVKQNTLRGSWIWSKLLKYREMAKSFCKVEVGNGATTSFWYDDWSAMGRLIEVAGARGAIDMGIPRMMTVENAWKTRRRRRHRADYLNKIEDLLASQGQRRTLQADIVLWRRKGDIFKGKFSTKDTWNHIRTTSHTVSWHKGIWFTHATPKYSFCVWLATHDRLATGDRMVKWNGGATGSCVFCKNNMESRDHLFFTCRYVSEIWTSLAKGVFKNSFSINWHQTLNHVSNQKLDRVEGFLVRYVFQATVYMIWRERNGRRHGEDENSTDQLIRWIDKQVRNQLSTIRQMGDKRYEEGFQQWLQLRA